MNIHDFYIGKSFDAYTYFGSHMEEDGVVFRVYAPKAEKVELIGDFNGWNGSDHVMVQDGLSGIYSIKIPGMKSGDLYKYRIYHKDGTSKDRFDPYGNGSEVRPRTATRVVDLNAYQFTDQEWMDKRTKNYDSPVNIYEIHAGSWRKNQEGENGWYRYDQLAERLIPYVKEMGYTHVEFLPLAEHPSDESWGYQVSGFFCPTSRYGDAVDLKKMVDLFHKEGIGVIMDFVPVHFVKNDYCLLQFDGTPLYEYPEPEIGYSEWGTCNFNYYRGDVCTFLQSAADFWLSVFHFDGIRMDAISNVIYWQGDYSKGVNAGAIKFIQTMNQGLQERHPTAMLIAEDSTNYPKVTAPVEYDGLGFDYKWDMGWMNDTLNYFKLHPYDRKFNYHKLSFSMAYFYREHYILPLSHDEVVHGKATIIQKMWGHYDLKFQQVKTLYAYMFTHPGKKLNFMGNEIGMFREWDESKECDWMLLDYPKHRLLKEYLKELNHLYTTQPAFYDGDYNSEHFRWLEVNAKEERVYIYERFSGDNRYVIVLNMSDNEYPSFRFGYDHPAVFQEALSGERTEYGGYFSDVKEDIWTEKRGYKWFDYSVTVHIPALGAIIYKVDWKEECKCQEDDKFYELFGLKLPEDNHPAETTSESAIIAKYNRMNQDDEPKMTDNAGDSIENET